MIQIFLSGLTQSKSKMGIFCTNELQANSKNIQELIVTTKGLVTNYGEGGGLQNGRGGHVKFCPYEKGGGAEKVLAMLKGGHKKFWGHFYVVA